METTKRDAILSSVSFAAQQFLRGADFDENMNVVLARLGQAVDASRVHIFKHYVDEHGALLADQIYGWVADGIDSHADNQGFRRIDIEGKYQRMFRVLHDDEFTHWLTRDLPESERSIPEAQGILSVAIVPIFADGEIWGYVVFDDLVTEREWAAMEIDALKAAAGTIGAAVQRRMMEEALRRTLHQAILAQEEERRRIARELHDSTSQVLAGVSAQIEAVNKALPRDMKSVKRQLTEAQQSLSDIFLEVRRIILELRPSMLDDLGLAAAIRWLARTNLGRAGIKWRFRTRGKKRDSLPTQLETALFRIAQEAIANTIKHAAARNVTIDIEFSRNSVMLQVADDGKGFDLNAVRKLKAERHGLGLTSMEERAQILGGEFMVDSHIGRGTRVTVRVPIQQETLPWLR